MSQHKWILKSSIVQLVVTSTAIFKGVDAGCLLSYFIHYVRKPIGENQKEDVRNHFVYDFQ